MRVVVLHLDIPSQAPPEVEDSLLTARQIVEVLTANGHLVELVPFDPDYDVFARSVSACEPDLVFNMVEHAMGQDQLAAVAPAYLEKMGMPYTGAGPAAIVAT
ncbi:MAG TPA: hypothetical protein VIJ85_06165, partial [Rhizomicrobium sp.]